MTINLPRVIRLRDRKLGRERAMGMAHYGKVPLVEIDPLLGQKDRLSTLVHEIIHIVFPTLSESQTIQVELRIAAVLWRDGWRRLAPESPKTKPTKTK